MEEDDGAETDASTIEKTWALAYEAKVRPSASDNMMKERLEGDSSGDQEEGLENRKTVIPVKDSVAVYAGVLSCSRVRNAEARAVR